MDIKSVAKPVEIDIKAATEARDRSRKEQQPSRRRGQKANTQPVVVEKGIDASGGSLDWMVGQTIDSQQVVQLLSKIPPRSHEAAKALFESRRTPPKSKTSPRKIDKSF